ncbi:putative P-type Ca(2+) transporter [Helianthus annuus]|nr:putative P-type Ca(2+) transporter [Helianthus annuus]
MFGLNSYEKPPLKGLLYFVAKALKDVTILVLMVCAVLSLGFGIKEDGIKDGWYEGGSILLAVFIVVVVSAVGNFRQEKQFDSLSKISNNIKIDVVREGRRQKISIFDIVVGDIVVLNIGDQIPADGLFIDGHSLLWTSRA